VSVLQDDLPVILVEAVSGAPGGLWACRVRLPDGRKVLLMLPSTPSGALPVILSAQAAAVLWPT
jgi:hypothetical protein